VDEVTAGAKSSIVTLVAQRTRAVPARRGGAPLSKTLSRVGSGVAIEPDLILTTASVVNEAERIRVRASNGLESDAKIVALDAVFNLALLRVDQLRLPPLPLADPRIIPVGDWVITLATSYRAQSTQSVGYVSYRYNEPRTALLQTTNTVYPGNSGGAALNSLGQLIGIIQGELSTPDPAYLQEGDPRPSGNSFVLPIDVIRRILPMLRQQGRVPHGYFGATTSAATVTSESQPGASVPIGARVESVVAGSPAERAGLMRGDLIVGFDLERVEYPAQLARWVSMSRPGTGIRITLVREEEQRVTNVRLSESPYSAPQWATLEIPVRPARGRIAEIQRQIRKLDRELKDLKSPNAASR
jgi:serine protease Do